MVSDVVQAISSVFEAVGTVAAVVVALFLQVFRVKKKRPMMSVAQPNRNDDDFAYVEVDDLLLTVRAKVWNEEDKDSAYDAQVLLSDIEKPPQHPIQTVPSRNLKWADVPTDYVAVPSGTWRRVDLLHLIANRPGEPKNVLAVALQNYEEKWPPLDRERLKVPGHYVLHLTVTASNCTASTWTVSFDYSPTDASSLEQLATMVRNLEVKRA